MYGYSGPLLIGTPETSSQKSYSGPLLVRLGSSLTSTGSPYGDYTGPLRTVNLGGSTCFHYYVAPDWYSWNGPYRVSGDTLYLAFSDALSQMGIDPSLAFFHYEWGNTQDPDGSLPSPEATFTANGIQVNGGYIAIDGDPEAWEIVNDTSQASFVFGGWIQWGPDSSTAPQGCLFGFLHTYWTPYDDTGSYYYQPSAFRTLYKTVVRFNSQGSHSDAWMEISGVKVDHQPMPYGSTFNDDGEFLASIPLSLIPAGNGEWHHLVVQIKYHEPVSSKYIRIQLLLDGNLILDFDESEESILFEDIGYVSFDSGNDLDISAGGEFTPGVLSLSTTPYQSQPSGTLPSWGTRSYQEPFNAVADELFSAKKDISVPTSLISVLMVQQDNNSTEWYNQAITNTSWSSGDEHWFNPARYPSVQIPDPSNETDDNTWTIYGPVELSGQPSTGGITTVTCTHDVDIDAGERVFVSIRANQTSFIWNDDTLSWGDWQDLSRYSGTSRPVGGGGSGQYVQMRVRIIPSDDTRRINAPGISRLDYCTSATANEENHPPTAPGTTLMTVDGINSSSGVALVARYPSPSHVFIWSAGNDPDIADIPILTYDFQIANRSDFASDPVSGSPSILYEGQNISSTSLNLPIDLISGSYFWRVRTFDDKAYSPWSNLGYIQVNVPPNAPYGLAVYQTS